VNPDRSARARRLSEGVESGLHPRGIVGYPIANAAERSRCDVQNGH
jgi:hypothetical protein